MDILFINSLVPNEYQGYRFQSLVCFNVSKTTKLVCPRFLKNRAADKFEQEVADIATWAAGVMLRQDLTEIQAENIVNNAVDFVFGQASESAKYVGVKVA